MNEFYFFRMIFDFETLVRSDSISDMCFSSILLSSFISASSFFLMDSMFVKFVLDLCKLCSLDSNDFISKTIRSFSRVDTLLEYDSFNVMNSSNLDIVSLICSRDLSVSLTEMDAEETDLVPLLVFVLLWVCYEWKLLHMGWKPIHPSSS